ncbi:hypothetical protein N6H14_29460 [Paenibacillus sp. CC-CFT747]|nr:hypothetical protein N6H14_29460 [Paenibacillus sp. CC-CFT747]
MFDPTIYENLKVVAEGAVYDLDLKGELLILGRSDRVELASMSRAYAIRFRLPDKPEASAEFRLEADTYDLSAEILEKREAVPGCRLELFFNLP